KVKQNLEKADELRDEYRNTDDAEKKAETGEQILTLENESYELREEATQLFSESRESENRYWQQAGRVAVHNFLVELDKMQRVLYPETAREETKTVENDTSLMIAAYDLFNIPGIENPRTQEKDQENELIYKIQIGAYSRGLPAYVERLYKKLSFIRKIENYTDEDGVVVYTTGNLKNLEDAIKMQNQVKQEGVEDAFVVPYFKGKRITLEEAKKLEAEK
ncbi:MAG: SPOR domain-containing protein, partial [Tangfeifania sp.]